MIINPRYNFVFEDGKLIHPTTFAQRVDVTLPDRPLEDIIAEAYPQKTEQQRRLGSINHVSVVHLLMRLSNIDELMVPLMTGDHPSESLARYILIRRCLRKISREYPELRKAVNKVIRTKYRPDIRLGAIVIPDDFEDLRQSISGFKRTDTRTEHQRRLLEQVLQRQTDYAYFVNAGLDVNEVRIRCCKAVEATYGGHLSNAAIREAQRIKILLSPSQQHEQGSSQPQQDDDPFL